MTRLFIPVFLSIFFLACRSTRNIQTAIIKKDSVPPPVVVLPVKDLRADTLAFLKESYDQLMNNRISFTTFSAKVDVDYQDVEGKNYNVNAHLRMYKDSVIWVSITAILGIEGLRAYITRDSVKLLDKQNKVYTARSVSYLQEVSALPLNLSSLQELLIGNPVFITPFISYSKTDNIVSFQGVGEFFKFLITMGAADKLLQSGKFDDIDESHNRTCYLTYSDYEKKQGVNFPSKRTLHMSEKKKLDIKLNFKSYDFNETLSFPFSVPKSYTPN